VKHTIGKIERKTILRDAGRNLMCRCGNGLRQKRGRPPGFLWRRSVGSFDIPVSVKKVESKTIGGEHGAGLSTSTIDAWPQVFGAAHNIICFSLNNQDTR
jgi:hypothetical protein